MSTPPQDPEEYKKEERRDWDQVAGAWARWWPTIDAAFRPLTDRLLDLVQVRAGQRLLDVATGTGEPALTAASRVGPAGRVVATDLSPGMLAVARQRAAERGLDNVEFLEADGETLEGVDGAFDGIVCRLGFMLLPDPGRAAARMGALLVPGGRIGLAVWGRPERVPFLSAAQSAVRQLLGAPAPAPDEPGPFRFADEGSLSRVLRGAGFTHVGTEPVEVVAQFESPQEYARFAQEVSPSMQALKAQQPAERYARIVEAVTAAAGRHAGSDGRVRFENEAVCAVAAK
jgi:ubiquinone/menaquinone biosynthesis C-methylase UbiE